MLRCISRFDLVGQGRSEASLFAAAAAAGSGGEQTSPTGIRASLRRGFFSSSRPGKPDGVDGDLCVLHTPHACWRKLHSRVGHAEQLCMSCVAMAPTY